MAYFSTVADSGGNTRCAPRHTDARGARKPSPANAGAVLDAESGGTVVCAASRACGGGLLFLLSASRRSITVDVLGHRRVVLLDHGMLLVADTSAATLPIADTPAATLPIVGVVSLPIWKETWPNNGAHGIDSQK